MRIDPLNAQNLNCFKLFFFFNDCWLVQGMQLEDQLHWNQYFMLEFIKKQVYGEFLNFCMLKGGNGRKNVFGHENRKIFK